MGRHVILDVTWAATETVDRENILVGVIKKYTITGICINDSMFKSRLYTKRLVGFEDVIMHIKMS